MRDSFESDFDRHIDQQSVALFQELFGSLETHSFVHNRRRTVDLVEEQSLKLPSRNTKGCGKLSYGQCLLKISLHHPQCSYDSRIARVCRARPPRCRRFCARHLIDLQHGECVSFSSFADVPSN